MRTNQMLAFRAWLETRYRILLPLVMFLVVAVIGRSGPSPLARGLINAGRPPLPRIEAAMMTLPVFLLLVPIMLAGSGIRTQSPFRATRGLHGSVCFTLSLPVSRFRLLAVRAALGYVESCVLIGLICLAMPSLIPQAPPLSSDFALYWLALTICATAYYSFSVLLSTFLDDAWQLWIGMLSLFVSLWLCNTQPVPDSLNIFHAIGIASPLFTHTLPWATMGFSLAIACVLLAASWKIVQSSEY